MLSLQRHRAILDSLHRQGAITIRDLAHALDVSFITVRRDLELLEQQGLLRRVHGGAVSVTSLAAEPPFVRRTTVHQTAKKAIAQLAVSLIQPGEQILLGGGSTVLAMCPYLEPLHDLTLITYSLPVVQAFNQQDRIRVICTGGEVDPHDSILGGPLAEQMIEKVRVDKAFLGTFSVNAEEGFSVTRLPDLALSRLVIQVAREVYVLADSSKFTSPASWLVAKLDVVTALITDDGAPLDMLEQLKHAGERVLIAPTANQGGEK